MSEPGAPKIELREIVPGRRIEAGPFSVEYVPVAHSIPEIERARHPHPPRAGAAHGRLEARRTPYIGNTTAEASFRALGDEGSSP
jgi:ribonuclease J